MRGLTLVLFLLVCLTGFSQPPMRILVLAEKDKNHSAFVERARPWLDTLAKTHNLSVDYIDSPAKITDAFLAKYNLIFQMNYPPYMWGDSSKAAFQRYIVQGKGGWVGLHHATLLGEFDGYKMWDWFSNFMGGIRFRDYIPGFASATVNVEGFHHPVMKGIPVTFHIEREEWYTYDRSPRSNVMVLASVDESTYSPKSDKVMGDHPVVWTNFRMKSRNVYIFMGHDPILFDDGNYKRLLQNAILWAGGR